MSGGVRRNGRWEGRDDVAGGAAPAQQRREQQHHLMQRSLRDLHHQLGINGCPAREGGADPPPRRYDPQPDERRARARAAPSRAA